MRSTRLGILNNTTYDANSRRTSKTSNRLQADFRPGLAGLAGEGVFGANHGVDDLVQDGLPSGSRCVRCSDGRPHLTRRGSRGFLGSRDFHLGKFIIP